MLKRRTMTSLAIAAAVTTTAAFSAFAAESDVAAVPSKTAEISLTTARNSDEAKGPAPELKTDENGNQYFITKDGFKITITQTEVNPEDISNIELSIVPAE